MKIKENVNFKFTPHEFKITEGEDNKGTWLSIGGIALTEGISKNNRKYTFMNLQENDARDIKFVFGHPDEVEEHIVGTGKLNLSGEQLLHEGKIRNTSRHPDVVESVKDGFLGPSIHDTAKKVTLEENAYVIEGLTINGVGLVGFQGVESASIDYAIAESFNEMNDLTESEDSDANNDQEVDNMPEEEKKEEVVPEAPAEKAEEPEAAPEEPKESIDKERFAALEKELNDMKVARKAELVESIVKLNSDLKEEALFKESEGHLKTVLEYEKKLSETSTSAAVVESEETTNNDALEMNESADGSVTLSEAARAAFNKELKERIR